MPALTLSVIIPVRNGAATLGDCLRSVLAARAPGGEREILVVDNQSTDGTVEIVKSYPVRLIHESRRGAGHARNRGIRESRGEIVVFLDADCLASAGWLVELTSPFHNLTVAATAGEVIPYPSSTQAERYIARRKPFWQEWSRSEPLPWFLAGNVAFRREVFDRIGLFDPRFEKGNSEDIDLSWRFFQAGLRLQYCPKAFVFHRNRSTLRGLFAQQLRNGRGQGILWRKYRPKVRWGLREELRAWADLGRAAGSAIGERVRATPDGREAGRPADAVDFLRKLAQRIGFLRGALEWNGFPRSR